jgi:hypothetical protein
MVERSSAVERFGAVERLSTLVRSSMAAANPMTAQKAGQASPAVVNAGTPLLECREDLATPAASLRMDRML